MSDASTSDTPAPAMKKSPPAEITDCPACMRPFIDPRTLPCVHTYCFDCLVHWATVGGGVIDDLLTCPTCGAQVNVCETFGGSLDNVPHDAYMTKLVEMRKLEHDLTIMEPSCDLCGDSEHEEGKQADPVEPPTAVCYCVECRQGMCPRCVAVHGKFRGINEHKLIKFGGQLQADDLKLMFPDPTCERHPGKAFVFYCEDCKCPTCPVCFVDDHSSHRCADLNEVAREMRETIRPNVASLKERMKTVDEQFRRQIEKDKALGVSAATTKSDINRRELELQRQISFHTSKMLAELESIQKTENARIESLQRQTMKRLDVVRGLQRRTEELLSKGSAYDIVRETGRIHDRMLHLMASDAGSALDDDRCATASLIQLGRPRQQLDELLLSGLFGDLVVTTSTDEDPTAGAGKTPTTQSGTVQTLPSSGTGGVSGIACLGNEVFVVRKDSQAIEVFDATSLLPRRQIGLTTSTATQSSLAACATNNVLYMTEYHSSKLFRIDLAPKRSGSHAVTSWPVGSWPFGVSVNSSHNVLVACYGGNKLQEFTTGRALVREIVLTSDMEHPVGVVQLAAGLYGVVHQGPGLHRYCVVGADGRVFRAFGDVSGSGASQLNMPYGLAVSKRGSVVIADSGNHRLIKLNPSTFAATELIVAGGLNCPYSIHLDDERSRLYIGELNGGCRVLILSL